MPGVKPLKSNIKLMKEGRKKRCENCHGDKNRLRNITDAKLKFPDGLCRIENKTHRKNSRGNPPDGIYFEGIRKIQKLLPDLKGAVREAVHRHRIKCRKDDGVIYHPRISCQKRPLPLIITIDDKDDLMQHMNARPEKKERQ